MYVEPCFFLYFMSCHTGCSKLRENQSFVIHNLFKGYQSYTIYQFPGAESPFSCSTPDVDSFCVKYKDPSVDAGQVLSEIIKGELIVGSNEDIRIRTRRTHLI